MRFAYQFDLSDGGQVSAGCYQAVIPDGAVLLAVAGVHDDTAAAAVSAVGHGAFQGPRVPVVLAAGPLAIFEAPGDAWLLLYNLGGATGTFDIFRE